MYARGACPLSGCGFGRAFLVGVAGLALFLAGCVSDPVDPTAKDHFSIDQIYETGLIYFQGGKFDLAERQFQNAIERKPDFWEGHLALANTFYYQSRILRQKKDRIGALNRLNMANARFQQVMQAEPELSEPLIGLALVYLEDSRFYDKAIENLERALVLEKDKKEKNLRCHFYLGSALGLTGKLAESAQHYEKYLELFPAAPDRPEVEDILEDNYKRRGIKYERKPGFGENPDVPAASTSATDSQPVAPKPEPTPTETSPAPTPDAGGSSSRTRR